MHRKKAGFTASRLASSSRRARRTGLAVGLVALAAVSMEGAATASAPLKVCATCAYTDIPVALAAAAAQSGDDTIQIAAGSYPEAITVSTNVTLLGVGAEAITIGKVGVEAGVVVTIKGLTIDGGPSGFPDDANGVRNAGTLTLKNSVVTGNAAIFGAGVYNESTGTMTVKDSSITGNSAVLGSGGGVVNEGTMMLQNTAVSGNGTFGVGGGIDNTGALTLRESMVSDNRAFGAGAGIYNGVRGIATIRNSTISGNELITPADGGGIANHGTLSLRDSTVSANSAPNRGGGIYNGATGTGTLTKSGVTGNTAPIGPGIFNDGGTMTIKDSSIQP